MRWIVCGRRLAPKEPERGEPAGDAEDTEDRAGESARPAAVAGAALAGFAVVEAVGAGGSAGVVHGLRRLSSDQAARFESQSRSVTSSRPGSRCGRNPKSPGTLCCGRLLRA